MTDKKKEAMGNGKKSALTADISMASIRSAMNNIGKKKLKDDNGTLVPDNSKDDFTPALPEVNLLPPRVKETYAAQDLGKKFIIGGTATAAIFAALFGVSLVSANIYEGKLQEVQNVTSQYQAEISGLNAYSGYRTAIDTKRQELGRTVQGQIDVGAANAAFKEAAEGAGYDIANVSLSVAASGAAGEDAAAMSGACVNPDPFTPATGVGCLTFSLTDDGSGASLTELYQAANASDSGFTNIYVPSALNGEEGATIDGSVSLTEKFIMNEYDELAIPLDTLLSDSEPLPEDTTGEDLEGN